MPIINSLLDLDFYKLTMMQFAWKHFPSVSVKLAFKNRTKAVALAQWIREEDLRAELEHLRTLRFTEKELDYLQNGRPSKFFCRDFIEYLRNFKLPPFLLERDGDTYRFEVEGNWPEETPWETLYLSVVNELYYHEKMKREDRSEEAVWRDGLRRLNGKISILKQFPKIKFSDFGTRRRFSRRWQKHALRVLKIQLPDQLIGTSNVLLAMELDLQLIGTFAHEMFMVFFGIFFGSDDDIRSSHNKVLQMWLEMYGEALSIALTDTYGSDFFFRDMTTKQAKEWRALRQDSGDPIEFGEKAILFYKKKEIDPREKTIVFSDGLDIETIVRIALHFDGRIGVLFGWGTNLMNDLGFEALSLVVKVTRSNGVHTVKLSDNMAKAMGRPEDIERCRRIFGHTHSDTVECRY